MSWMAPLERLDCRNRGPDLHVRADPAEPGRCAPRIATIDAIGRTRFRSRAQRILTHKRRIDRQHQRRIAQLRMKPHLGRMALRAQGIGILVRNDFIVIAQIKHDCLTLPGPVQLLRHLRHERLVSAMIAQQHDPPETLNTETLRSALEQPSNTAGGTEIVPGNFM